MAKKTIAFLTSGITDGLTREAFKGIEAAAENDDVNFITVPVKYIGRDFTGLPDKYEYQYEITANFLKKENVSGLIVAADYIGCLTTREVLVRFMEILPDVPIVLMASKIPGYAGVTFDNTKGIKDALEYLYTRYGTTKIGMLGGPEGNSDADERKAAYLEFLQDHGIEFKENWFVESNLTVRCRPEAEKLLQQFPDVEAIFCVNDDTAIALYDVMKNRGLEPGADIKVFGFDNSVAGSLLNPSLTTIDAGAYDLGGYAYKMLKRKLEGEHLENEMLPTRFICRDSFGSINETVKFSVDKVLDKGRLGGLFDQLFYRFRECDSEESEEIREDFIHIMEEIIDIIGSHDRDEARIRRLKHNIRAFLKEGALDYTDYDELVPFIERLQAEMLTKIDDCEGKQIIYEVVESLYKSIIKVQNNNNVKDDEYVGNLMNSMKALVRDSLNFSYANDLSYLELIAHLDWMNIKNAYLYIFDKPIVHLQNEVFNVPETLNLKAVLKDGVPESVPFSKQRIPSAKVFSNEETAEDDHSLVIMPLHFGDTVYGIIVHELTEMTFKNGEFLTNQLGTAARMIDILRVNNDVQKQLEDSIAVMRQHNIELDKLSRNDVLTGILNRRGFNDNAPAIIQENLDMGHDVLFLYIDMNNLKIINDRFGHEEGDFSLKTISHILADVIDERGIVGRIGGDEYAMIYCGLLNEKELNDRIKATFDAFNKHSDKPYNISVSCGFCRISSDNRRITLEEAMSVADRDLYIAKQNKDNRIVKTRSRRA